MKTFPPFLVQTYLMMANPCYTQTRLLKIRILEIKQLHDKQQQVGLNFPYSFSCFNCLSDNPVISITVAASIPFASIVLAISRLR